MFEGQIFAHNCKPKFINLRLWIRSYATNLQNKNGFSERPEPNQLYQDYIGPPDKESNLRPYVRCIPNKESSIAAHLRIKRIEVEAWNQAFWSRHNKRFYEEKSDFLRCHKAAGSDEIAPDKMSEFYKSFLDKNKRIHLLYNVSWYLKNITLLILALKVKTYKLFIK